MKTPPRTSLFLTTYNWPEALSLCLQSIADQTHLPDEVIVADDGSKDDTRQLVEEYQQKMPFTIHHCWQKDEGFRINAIRNKALLKAQHPYIIQIDGDVILDRNFVHDHLQFAKAGRLIAGRRLRLSADQTDTFCKLSSYEIAPKFRQSLIAKLHHHLLYSSSTVKGVRGCNLSYWKEDAFKVNGYDEDWVGKGPDDKEFALRLVNSGVKVYNLKFYAIQHHLHHGEEGLLDNYRLNQMLYKNTHEEKRAWCQNGLTNS